MYNQVFGYRVEPWDPDGELIGVELEYHSERWTVYGVPDQIEELLRSTADHIRERYLKRK